MLQDAEEKQVDLVGLLLEWPDFNSSLAAAPAISSREDFQVLCR